MKRERETLVWPTLSPSPLSPSLSLSLAPRAENGENPGNEDVF